MIFVWQSTGSNEPGASQQPKETLTVAGSRVVSPCQALPETSVQQIFGTFGPKSYIDERYYARSVNEKEIQELGSSFPSTVNCKYFVDTSDNATVELKIEQFETNELALRDWKEAASYNKAQATDLLNKFEAGIPNAAQYNLDPEKLQAAADAFKGAIDASIGELEVQQIDSISGSILFAPNRDGFIAIRENRIYTLSYQFGSNNFFDDSRNIDQTEVVLVTDKVKSTFDTIFKNVDKAELSQAPSPTLRGIKAIEKIGATKVLDSCEVLADETVTSALGVKVLNPRVERKSIIKNPEIFTNDSDVLPNNSCLKRLVNSDRTTGYVSLELGFATDISSAEKYVTSSVKASSTTPASDTAADADRSKFIEYTRGSVLVQFVRFQHGSYAGTLTIAKNGPGGQNIKIEKKVFESTLNDIVENL